MRKFTFFLKAFSWWTRDSNSRPTTHGPVDDAICEGISPLGYWQKVNQSPTQTKPYNIEGYY